MTRTDPALRSIQASEYFQIQAELSEHPTRAYWTQERRQQLAERMLRAVDGNPLDIAADERVGVNWEQWVGLANDMKIADDISPGQYAAEIASIVEDTTP